MGGLRNIRADGGFDEILYYSEGEIEKYGIHAKIITMIGDINHHESLPLAAGNTNVYLKSDRYGNIWQMRIYSDRKATIDIDWGHKHNGMQKGVVHIHFYTYDKDGKPIRSTPRYLNNDEIKKYGKFIKFVAPEAKLRPGRKKR